MNDDRGTSLPDFGDRGPILYGVSSRKGSVLYGKEWRGGTGIFREGEKGLPGPSDLLMTGSVRDKSSVETLSRTVVRPAPVVCRS